MQTTASSVTDVPDARAAASERADRLEELFEAHRDRLYALAVRMAVAGDDAVDLVQETFLRAAGSRDSIPAGDAAERWLVRVLVNLCRDRYRRRGYRAGRRAELRRARAGRTARSPESAVAARDAVQSALAQLPPRRRAIVVMRELEDRDTKDVAAALGLSSATVRWHLSQARRQLRDLLAPEEIR